MRGKYFFTYLISLIFASQLLLFKASALHNDIQISPTKSPVFNLDANDNQKGSFEVSNIGDNDFSFQVQVLPYSISSDSTLENFDQSTTYNQISSWITAIPEKSTLAPGETTHVNYTINTPEIISGGGQYAAITVEVINTPNLPSDNNIIATVGRIGYIVYAHLSGEIHEEASIIKNSIPTILFDNNIHANSIIENTGNVDIDAEYQFEVYNFFNGSLAYSNESNNNVVRRTLPESKQYVTFAWNGSPKLGIFKVKQNIKLLDHTYINERIVFVCPFWLIILVFIFIASIIIWLITRAHHRKIINKGV